ncbi:MAG: ribonuclease III [Candidatus Neomarinimicrobiota bacterium]
MGLFARLKRQATRRTPHTRTKFEGRLGYTFRDPRLLTLALTHRSVTDLSHQNFERLEFLGDAVLSHVVSIHLYTRFQEASEGDLTMRRSALVNKDLLASVGEDLQVHQFIKVNSGVKLSDPKVRRNLVGDVVEALIGALYLDGGMAASDRFIRQYVLKHAKSNTQIENSKGRLIELCHRQDLGNPKFQLLRTKGPEHDKKFVVRVKIGRRTFESAQADTKKAAEQEAAGLALEALGKESR